MSLLRRRQRLRPSWRCPMRASTLASTCTLSMSLWTCFLLVFLWLPLASATLPAAPAVAALPSVISRIHYLLIANNNPGGDLGKIVVDPHSPSLLAQAHVDVPLQRRSSVADRAVDESNDKDDKTTSTTTTNYPIKTKTPSPSSETTGDSSSTSSPSGAATSKPTEIGSPTEKTKSPTPTESDNKPLPSPFDSNLGSNFTNPACEGFFHSFLGNTSFQDCLPVSLLLQSSLSFFEASRSVVRLTRTLDAACSIPRDSCSALMSDLATKLTSKENCGDDLKREQPIVIQAHNGLRSYGTVRYATCLKNPDTDNYCFSDSISNATNPSNAFIYYLPLGMPLPGSSRPTCNKCLQATMQSFSNAATTDNQPISRTYLSAANQINIECGPSFVVAAVKLGSENGASATTRLMQGSSLFGFNLIGGMAYILLFCVGMPLLGNIL
ncbi:uncharacterized protein BDCG_01527 [Blastomyces dermatitidis ER-3]|uniref:DUF7729 domain-containing protein n=1 Tax=Ajellomyces dermatitidis (strain ER-3 / ATCC MYA-2586) TaxID=559297 RepID=A0ABP2EU96_AJEDR|nr:uncharacterized protein BDCG_01527 [Blastomyces dermatitidis ER-3]EEQ86407.2 hypothetical protein BDCG_01527 [Blastomyces dermatitidis ER-3]